MFIKMNGGLIFEIEVHQNIARWSRHLDFADEARDSIFFICLMPLLHNVWK